MPQLSSCGGRALAPSSSPSSAPAFQLPARLAREPLQTSHLAAREVEPVLAQGMAREPFPQEDTPQVGVTLEAYPHQVERLPLLEVGATPDGDHGGDLRVVVVLAAGLQGGGLGSAFGQA